MRPVRIEIDVCAANDPDAHQWLDRMLHKIDDGWHVWDTAGLSDPNEIESTSWISDRGRKGDWVRQMLVASIRRGAWTLAPHGRRLRVTPCPNGRDELEPEDATRLVEEPLVILVENRYSDGAFVKRIMTELDKSLHQLRLRPGRPIVFDSLGGAGQMKQEVELLMKGKPYRPRLVAIVDSDRKGPEDTNGAVAQVLHSKCETLGVPCWILAKREADNYLPRVLLDEQQDAGAYHSRLVEAWDRLNDEQKNFFDVKNGLPAAPSAIEQALFDGLSQADQQILSRGFGPNVHERWNLWNAQPKTELLRRSQGDLERGIDLIRGEV